MSEEGALRQNAREAMRTGRLPRRPPDRMWGGPGSGATCAVCGRVITRDDMAFELEFIGSLEGSTSSNRHLHVRCFAAWEFERDNDIADIEGSAARPRDGDEGAGRASLREGSAGVTMGGRERNLHDSGILE